MQKCPDTGRYGHFSMLRTQVIFRQIVIVPKNNSYIIQGQGWKVNDEKGDNKKSRKNCSVFRNVYSHNRLRPPAIDGDSQSIVHQQSECIFWPRFCYPAHEPIFASTKIPTTTCRFTRRITRLIPAITYPFASRVSIVYAVSVTILLLAVALFTC